MSTRDLSFFTVGLILVIGLILTLPVALPGRVQLAVGQPAPTDIYAPQYFRYESDVLTTQDRENARQNAGPVYDYNSSLVDSQRHGLSDALANIQAIRGTLGAPDPTRSQRLQQLPNVQLTSDDILALLAASARRL